MQKVQQTTLRQFKIKASSLYAPNSSIFKIADSETANPFSIYFPNVCIKGENERKENKKKKK